MHHESTEPMKTTKSDIPIVLASTACNNSYPCLQQQQQQHVASYSGDSFKITDRSLTQVSQVRGHSTESCPGTQCTSVCRPCATRGTLLFDRPHFLPIAASRTTVNKRTTRRCSAHVNVGHIKYAAAGGTTTHNTLLNNTELHNTLIGIHLHNITETLRMFSNLRPPPPHPPRIPTLESLAL